MARTEAEQAIVDYLIAEPGSAPQVRPPRGRGWVAFAASDSGVAAGRGAAADLATIEFRKSRMFPSCQLHSVTFFSPHTGGATRALFRAWPEPDGSWLVVHIGGGSGRGPYWSRPRVSFTAQWNDNLFAAGGQVIGHGAGQARAVRLRFADGAAMQDRVERGEVLFFASPGVVFPARVDILDHAGVNLASYDADEFDP